MTGWALDEGSRSEKDIRSATAEADLRPARGKLVRCGTERQFATAALRAAFESAHERLTEN